MITTTAREIIRNASDLANCTNSSFLDFTLKTSIINKEYRKLYDQIVKGSNDFVKTIDIHGRETLLPPDCYQIVSVDCCGVPLSRGSIPGQGGYYVRNNVLHTYGGAGNVKLTYSTIPDTITAPDKAIKLEQDDIPTDGKMYFVDYIDKKAVFTENKSDKYLGKTFTYDLSTEKENEVYIVDNKPYNPDLTPMEEEPSGVPERTELIGKITVDEDNWYWRSRFTTESIAYTSDNDTYVDDSFGPIPRPDGTLSNAESAGFFKKVFKAPLTVNVFTDGEKLYNASLVEIQEPQYTIKKEPVEIGKVRVYNDQMYQKKNENWYAVTGFSPSSIYTDYNPVTDPSIISALNASDDVTISYVAYIQGTLINSWVRKLEGNYGLVETIDGSMSSITDTFDVAYLETLSFPEYFKDTFIAYSEYYTVEGFTPTEIKHSELISVTDVDEILRLDQITRSDVFFKPYLEQIDQTFTWDGVDVSEFIERGTVRTEQERKDGVKKDITVVNVQIHSPYMTVSYSDGVILIYTGWNRAVWNYNCITGHDTLGKVIALKTDDTTGKGCVWYNEEDGNYYYASFVPDTILNYPTSALFTLLEYRVAAVFCGLLNMENQYLMNNLLPEAESNFYSTLHYGNTAQKINHYTGRRWTGRGW